MKKLLVLYYSSYGHVETMANAVAEGARQVNGVQVDIKRVPELMPPEIAKSAGDLMFDFLSDITDAGVLL